MSETLRDRILRGRPVDPQVRMLMEKFGDKPRGAILRHAEIASAMGERLDDAGLPTMRYRAVMQTFRKRMLEQKSIWLKALARVGYTLCTPSQQLEEGARKFHAGRRTIKAAGLIAERVSEKELSGSQVDARHQLVVSSVEIEAQLRTDRRLVLAQLAPHRSGL